MTIGDKAKAKCGLCGWFWTATVVGVSRTGGMILEPMKCPHCKISSAIQCYEVDQEAQN